LIGLPDFKAPGDLFALIQKVSAQFKNKSNNYFFSQDGLIQEESKSQGYAFLWQPEHFLKVNSAFFSLTESTPFKKDLRHDFKGIKASGKELNAACPSSSVLKNTSPQLAGSNLLLPFDEKSLLFTSRFAIKSALTL
jgi:hypothetical protein